jgi:hypothetical protein
MIENPGLPNEALVLDTVTKPANLVMAFLENISQIGQKSDESENNE